MRIYVHLPDEPALQFVFVLQPELLDPRLDARTGAPLCLHGLVAADVNPRPRKQREHLAEHVLHEPDRRVVGVQQVVRHAPVRARLDRLARPTRARVRGDHGLRMAGHLDLRHDRDEALSGVGDDLPDLLLRVETAVTLAVEGRVGPCPLAADERLLPPRGDVRELRILLDLDAPALIVGEMPVEPVELVHRHQIQMFPDELERHEVTRDVEVRSSPGEPRHVLDRYRGHAPGNTWCGRRLIHGRQQQLPHRLDAVEHARGRSRRDRDGPWLNVKPVAFPAQRRFKTRLMPQGDVRVARRLADTHRAFAAGGGREARRQLPPLCLHGSVDDNRRRSSQRERPGAALELHGKRDDGDRNGRRLTALRRRAAHGGDEHDTH